MPGTKPSSSASAARGKEIAAKWKAGVEAATGVKILSEEPMSPEERRAYVDMCVATQVADHYDQLAQHYIQHAARANQEFWLMLRRSHKSPPHTTGLQINNDRLAIQFVLREGEMFKQFVIQPKRESNVQFIKPAEETQKEKK